MGADERDLVAVVAHEFAEPGLGAEPQIMMHFRTGLHEVQDRMRVRVGVDPGTPLR